MRIGMIIGADGVNRTVADLVKTAQQMEELKFDSVWMAQMMSYDAIGALSVIGHATQRIGLGTGVVPTYPRHPTALASQALTAASVEQQPLFARHRSVAPDRDRRHVGLFVREARRAHARIPRRCSVRCCAAKRCSTTAPSITYTAYRPPLAGAKRVPLLVAALGPAMLKLTGELADGTITWMVGPKTMEKHIIPSLTAAARGAGKPAPIVVGGFPVVLTNKPDEARAAIAQQLTIYGQLPSYRAMLDREGVKGPADIALAGDENYLRGAIDRLRNIGVTDFNVAIAGADAATADRTLQFLASLNG